MAAGLQIVIDCADPARLARFWAEALGYREQPPPAGYDSWPAFLEAVKFPKERWDQYNAVADPDGKGPRILFQKVPERKTVKNRVHLDVHVSGDHSVPAAERRARIEAAAERLVTLGATKVGPAEEPALGYWWIVMRDPEENEFCVV